MTDLGAEWDKVGGGVRKARIAAGITVRELARRIGVSASHVSQVERGIGAFSVPALYAVARELRVPMSHLLDVPVAAAHRAEKSREPEPAGKSRTARLRNLDEDGVVQRSGSHPSIKLSSGPKWSRLTPEAEPGIEFLEVVYQPGTTESAEHITHEGREYGFLISGNLTVEVEGIKTTLESGDSIVFDSMLPHRFWNDSNLEARAIWFVRDRPPGDPIPHS